MEKFFAYQKDSRTPCKFGRKCYQTNEEHINKYKHPPTKDDVKIDVKKKTRKRDAKGKIKSNDTNGESSNINNINYLNEENQISLETNDIEVPEQTNNINAINSEADSIMSNNQQHSTGYVIPQIQIQRSEQQQLLLTNTSLEDCSGDDGIVPCTPTLFTPRRLDGETVSSPHVPSSNQVQQFTFVGESQVSQNSDLNDGVHSDPSEETVMQSVTRHSFITDIALWNTEITKLFLIGEMPKDFYDLWYFCKSQCPTHPEDALLSVGLKLVGPYDLLGGHLNEFDANDVEKNVLHWRYYYDPPEFQTIIASTESQLHIGYYRDQPLEMPVYIASNDPDKNCIIKKLGKNIFQALRNHLKDIKNEVSRVFQKKLLAYEKQKNVKILEGRKVLPVTRTFHKAGIVVPYDKKTDVGYRPLSESEKTLRKILKCYCEASDSKKIEAMDKLQPIINYANIACDECDFGTGLQLGIDIFCDGNPELHRICKQLLVTVYNLLRRPQFGIIIKAHLNNRRKNNLNMSIL